MNLGSFSSNFRLSGQDSNITVRIPCPQLFLGRAESLFRWDCKVCICLVNFQKNLAYPLRLKLEHPTVLENTHIFSMNVDIGPLLNIIPHPFNVAISFVSLFHFFLWFINFNCCVPMSPSSHPH